MFLVVRGLLFCYFRFDLSLILKMLLLIYLLFLVSYGLSLFVMKLNMKSGLKMRLFILRIEFLVKGLVFVGGVLLVV